MGNLWAKIKKSLSSNYESRILMLGLDAAGKTTVLNKLELGETVVTVPTVGFNVAQVQYKKLHMTLFDVGGQHRIRPLWRHYYQGTDALIYVVDSNDAERMDEAAEELHAILQNDLMKDAAILVLANKMDLPNAASVKKVAQKMGLDKERRRPWHVQGAIATKGDGLFEGLDWVDSILSKRRAKAQK